MIDLDATASFIARFEGFVDHVYVDAAGVETVGYGETRRDVIERCRQSGISQQDALDLLKVRVQEFADGVAACITNTSALTPNRHAAFTSFAYNVGVGAFRDSTACKRFNAGDVDGVPEALSWWNKAAGKVLEGLSRRREAEAALYMGDAGAPAADPDPPARPDLLREGDRGDKVRDVQARLVPLGYPVAIDGAFGPGTTAGVRAFQQRCGLDADGVVGPATWQSLRSATYPFPPWPGRMLGQGAGGDDVRQAQARLAERGWAIKVDGQFGPKTNATVCKYQTEKALVVDGVVGPITWIALWTAPVTPPA